MTFIFFYVVYFHPFLKSFSIFIHSWYSVYMTNIWQRLKNFYFLMKTKTIEICLLKKFFTISFTLDLYEKGYLFGFFLSNFNFNLRKFNTITTFKTGLKVALPGLSSHLLSVYWIISSSRIYIFFRCQQLLEFQHENSKSLTGLKKNS